MSKDRDGTARDQPEPPVSHHYLTMELSNRGRDLEDLVVLDWDDGDDMRKARHVLASKVISNKPIN